MELSDAQFEQLVSMIADSRIELREAVGHLQTEIRSGFSGVRKNQIVLQETLLALEGDVSEIRKDLRAQDQALDGVTQLSKTNFDMIESILKELHSSSGSSTMGHGDAEESRGNGPQ